jgi:hypothetical protein
MAGNAMVVYQAPPLEATNVSQRLKKTKEPVTRIEMPCTAAIIAVLTATVIASFTVAIMIIALYGRDCHSYDIDIEGNATDKKGEANVEFISHIRVHNEGTD